MKIVLLVALLVFAVPSAVAASPRKSVSTAGMTLSVPMGWYATASPTPTCDPERLLVVASYRPHISASRKLSPPSGGQVLVLLLEDRYAQDRPLGDLHRPAHVSITWNRLAKLKPLCGNPDIPAFMRYFKTDGRYLGFMLYPRGHISPETRAKVLAVMDSLHASPR